MSKSPKIRKPAGTARRTATSRQSKSGSQRRSQPARQNARDSVRNGTKQALLIELLSGTKGASVPEMAEKAGWQHHSVRGFLSGTVKKKLGLAVTSAQVEGRGRVYRIARRD
jgi:hypothetical protein